MDKVKVTLFIIGQFIVISCFFYWHENQFIIKENFDKTSLTLEKATKELNKGIWAAKLSFLNIERSKSKQVKEINWKCEAQEKIQNITAFTINLVAKGDSKVSQFQLFTQDFNLPDVPEGVKGYLVDISSREYMTTKLAVEDYSKNLDIDALQYKALNYPNLILILGTSSATGSLKIISNICPKLILVFLFVVALHFYFYFLIRRHKEREMMTELNEQETEAQNKLLRECLHQTRIFIKEKNDVYQQKLDSINVLSTIVLNSNDPESSKILLSEKQERGLISKIHGLTTSINQDHLNLEEVNIKALFNEIESLLYKDLKDNSIDFSVEMGDGTDIVSCRYELKTLFLNLFHRTLITIPPGKSIKIKDLSSINDSRCIIIEIQDEGYEDLFQTNNSEGAWLSPYDNEGIKKSASQLNIKFTNDFKRHHGNNIRLTIPKVYQLTSESENYSEKHKYSNIHQLYS